MNVISIVLATYRRPALLAQALESFRALHAPSVDYEILVVDNGGDAETRRVATRASESLPLRFIVESRQGQNHGRNRGIREARGDLLVFTDDDVLADPGWLLELREGAMRWPGHAIFGGRVLPRWPAGHRPPAMHPFLRHAYAIADLERAEGCYTAGYVFGPNMAIRACLFEAGWSFRADIGPDGSDTYMTGGESELLLRLEQAGYTAVYLPRALVFHQIRPEQLRARWLHGRAFRRGRWDLTKTGVPEGPRMLGVPRSLLGQAGRAYVRFLLSRLSRNAASRLDRAVAYWRLRGMIYQCRRPTRAIAPPGALATPDPLGVRGRRTGADSRG
jgi:GT2 family glycosyltransferase